MAAERGPERIVVGITGASGAILGVRTLQALRAAGVETHLVVSEWAQRTLRTEVGPGIDLSALASFSYSADNLAARISSGSFRTGGMVIVPCSMNTVAAIAHGITSNLLQRAADVTLKERQRLVVVPRETPLSLVHLRNLTTLAEAGASIVPPMPGFYNRPQSVEDIVRHLVARILDQLDVPNELTHRWATARSDEVNASWAEILGDGAVQDMSDSDRNEGER